MRHSGLVTLVESGLTRWTLVLLLLQVPYIDGSVMQNERMHVLRQFKTGGRMVVGGKIVNTILLSKVWPTPLTLTRRDPRPSTLTLILILTPTLTLTLTSTSILTLTLTPPLAPSLTLIGRWATPPSTCPRPT